MARRRPARAVDRQCACTTSREGRPGGDRHPRARRRRAAVRARPRAGAGRRPVARRTARGGAAPGRDRVAVPADPADRRAGPRRRRASRPCSTSGCATGSSASSTCSPRAASRPGCRARRAGGAGSASSTTARPAASPGPTCCCGCGRCSATCGPRTPGRPGRAVRPRSGRLLVRYLVEGLDEPSLMDARPGHGDRATARSAAGGRRRRRLRPERFNVSSTCTARAPRRPGRRTSMPTGLSDADHPGAAAGLAAARPARRQEGPRHGAGRRRIPLHAGRGAAGRRGRAAGRRGAAAARRSPRPRPRALSIAVPEAKVVGLPETGPARRRRRADAARPGRARPTPSRSAPGLDDIDETGRLLRRVLDAAAAGRGRGPRRVRPGRAQPATPDLLAGRPQRVVLTPNVTEAGHLLGRDSGRRPRRRGRRRWPRCTGGRPLYGHVAAPDGRVWREESGDAGLGTSGSGDVLRRRVAGLLARGADPAQAACWGDLRPRGQRSAAGPALRPDRIPGPRAARRGRVHARHGLTARPGAD